MSKRQIRYKCKGCYYEDICTDEVKEKSFIENENCYEDVFGRTY